MAEHFKLEITNRSVKITTWHDVNDDFADEYAEILGIGRSNSETVEIDLDSMTDTMRTVFENAGRREPTEEELKASKAKSSSGDDSKYKVYNYNKRNKMRAEKFRTDAYMNFRVPNVQFVTLTFDPKQFANADDLEACHDAFRKFIKRLRYKIDDFIHITAFSKQKNGNWHYHMLCNLGIDVTNKLINDAWGLGLTQSMPITSYTEFDSKVSYCIDNMYEVAWDSLQGRDGYLHSAGLLKPVVLRSWKDSETDSAYKYLSEIIGGAGIDKPTDVSSKLLPVDNSANKQGRVSYKISHKVFHELFKDVKVAKVKQ